MKIFSDTSNRLWLFPVILGDGEVGKTSFLFRFCEDKFTEGYVPTIFENYHKEYEHDGVNKLLM